MNWATDGALLGTKAEFKRAFIDPIMEGQDPLGTFRLGSVARSPPARDLHHIQSHISVRQLRYRDAHLTPL